MSPITQRATQLLAVLDRDRDRLTRIDNYLHGRHDEPYMPNNADAEYRLIAQRSVSNWTPLLVDTPAQAMYVDSFRRGTVHAGDATAEAETPEWMHWQRSGLDARQQAVYRGALGYGHSFTLTERTRKGVRTKGLSPLRTAALFEDPANDDVPYVALTVTKEPQDNDKLDGEARMWDNTNEYKVNFKSYTDDKSVRVSSPKPHGASENPVTRFTAAVDLEGRTMGVVEPMIPLQNRINQTVFDLLVTQTYASFKVRWVTGMAPPMQMEPEYDDDGNLIGQHPVLDEYGNPVPADINHNAKRFLFAEDKDTNFGTLDETPLNGFIESIDMSIRHLAAVSQTPPHHLLGQIANLSAEALTAAETALSRKVEEFRKSFGESWERVFRLAAELDGIVSSAEDFDGEVIWRDMESRSLAQSADALGKLADQLEIPKRGLWARIPGVTAGELATWEELREDEDAELALASALNRSVPEEPAPPQEEEIE